MNKEKIKEKNNTINMRIDEELKKKFKIKCMEKGIAMSDVLEKYILDFIKD